MRRPTVLPLSGLLFVVFVARQNAAAAEGPDVLTITLVGDVGLNKTELKVLPRGMQEPDGVMPWADMTRGITDLVTGDLNFMNLETVVTERNDMRTADKRQKRGYYFRTHPNGVEHLADIGFNVMSAANNHTFDFGESGVRATLKHLDDFQGRGLLHYAGIGLTDDDAAAPRVIPTKGARIVFAAIGAITNKIAFHRAGPRKPGSLGYRFPNDWSQVTQRAGDTPGDFRMLSIHYGKERDILADEKQKREWRAAARSKDIDLVVGHHAHVVRGIERIGDSFIFYGLGNFLIRGARDMRSSPKLRLERDYGLWAKAHLAKGQAGRYRVQAVEIVPVVDMHRAPTRWPTKDAKARLQVVNQLSATLDAPSAGARGLRFQIREDGTGLYCTAEAKNGPAAIRALCRNYREPKVSPYRGKRSGRGKRNRSKQRPRKRR